MVSDGTKDTSDNEQTVRANLLADTKKMFMLHQLGTHPKSTYSQILAFCRPEGGSLVTIKRNIRDLRKTNFLSITDAPNGRKLFSLSEKGREFIDENPLSLSPHDGQEPLREITDRGRYDVIKGNWKQKFWDILIHTQREVILTTISASALNKSKKFADALFEDFRKSNKQIRIIAVRGKIPKKRMEQLKGHHVPYRVVNMDVLTNLRAYLKPNLDGEYPQLKDLCHIVVSDRSNWMYTGTNGNKNSMSGFGYSNDFKAAEHIGKILDTIWVTALTE